MRGTLVQWAILSRRGLRVCWADWPSMAMMLLQVPLITLLIAISFHRFMEDNADADRLARTVHYFRAFKTPYEVQGATVPLYAEIIPRVRASVAADRRLISVPSANQRGAIHFVLVSAAIWLGLIGSCKDVVNEQHVLNRESRACVRILPYLLSKFTVRVVLLAPQMAFMAFPIGVGLLDLTPHVCVSLWMVLWLSACTACALGLAISSVSSSVGFALTLVPILMIPQLILGGLLRPPAHATETYHPRVACQHLTIQRWGFEASLRTDPYAWKDVVAVEFSGWNLAARYGELNLLRSRSLGLVRLLIEREAAETALPEEPSRIPSLVMGAMMVSLLTLSCVVLHIRHVGFGLGAWAMRSPRVRTPTKKEERG